MSGLRLFSTPSPRLEAAFLFAGDPDSLSQKQELTGRSPGAAHTLKKSGNHKEVRNFSQAFASNPVGSRRWL